MQEGEICSEGKGGGIERETSPKILNPRSIQATHHDLGQIIMSKSMKVCNLKNCALCKHLQ